MGNERGGRGAPPREGESGRGTANDGRERRPERVAREQREPPNIQAKRQRGVDKTKRTYIERGHARHRPTERRKRGSTGDGEHWGEKKK